MSPARAGGAVLWFGRMAFSDPFVTPWRTAVVLDIALSEAEVQDAGEGVCGGRFVESAAFPGRQAYCKPWTIVGHHAAAREKIAGDLACDLSVNVPPVALVRWAGTGRPEQVCLSLRMFPAQRPWAQAKYTLSGVAPSAVGQGKRLMDQAVARAAARAFVFDTWVEQLDHEGPVGPSNILFGTEHDFSAGDFVFIDYEKSLFVGEKVKEPTKPAPFPFELRYRMDRAEASQAVSDIEALPDDVIIEIVRRIPADFLPVDEAQRIQGRLIERKPELRTALARHLEVR